MFRHRNVYIWEIEQRERNDEQIAWKTIIVEAALLKYFDKATWYHLMTLSEPARAIEGYAKGEKKTRRNRVQIYEAQDQQVGMRPRRTTRDLRDFYGEIISGRIIFMSIILQLATI